VTPAQALSAGVTLAGEAIADISIYCEKADLTEAGMSCECANSFIENQPI
jgi:hypothetical protein